MEGEGRGMKMVATKAGKKEKEGGINKIDCQLTNSYYRVRYYSSSQKRGGDSNIKSLVNSRLIKKGEEESNKERMRERIGPFTLFSAPFPFFWRREYIICDIKLLRL